LLEVRQFGDTALTQTCGSWGIVMKLLSIGILSAAMMTAVPAAMADTTMGKGGAPLTLPQCAAPLATIALVESQDPALAQYGLTSPVPVLRVMIQRSNCFLVVDRGQAFTRLQEEQALAGAPKTKVVKAKYFLTPNILFQNEDAGGAGGGLGSLLPGVAGAIGGAVRVQKSEAQVTITVTDTDTSIQVFAAEGSARTEDVGFLLGGYGGVIAGVGGAYENTDMGKTVTAALLDAYIKVVDNVRTTQASQPKSMTPVP
jgi:curli biogenesis system outer membrane secretion channel CsgG